MQVKETPGYGPNKPPHCSNPWETEKAISLWDEDLRTDTTALRDSEDWGPDILRIHDVFRVTRDDVSEALEKTHMNIWDFMAHITSIMYTLEDTHVSEDMLDNPDILWDFFLQIQAIEHELRDFYTQDFPKYRPELKHLWWQTCHILEPYRRLWNLLLDYEWIQWLWESTVRVIKNNIDVNIRQIAFNAESLKLSIDEYVNLSKQIEKEREINLNDILDTYIMKFQAAWVNVELTWFSDIQYKVNLWGMFVILENLFSNYMKYGNNGSLKISINNGKLDIHLENDKKEVAATNISSQIWNGVLKDVVTDMFWWEFLVFNTENSYTMYVSGLVLHQV